jgi:hypothetical protein
MGPRAACLLVSLLCACTEANPSYDPGVAPCSPGTRSCDGDKLMVCVNADPEPTLELEQTCTAPSVCKDGACVPNSAACPPPCTGNQVCAVFVVEGRVATYCSQPLGAKEPGQLCSTHAQCQSGLCVSGGKYPVCFRPCTGKNRECTNVMVPMHCIDAKVTVGGVAGTVAACVP